MTLRQKPSRMEKSVRNTERGFMLAGVTLLVISMGMAGKFGWGLGHDIPSKIGFATFFVLADFVGALCMSVVGLMFAWRWWLVGVITVFAMLFCVGFSIMSVFGFQSANRAAVSASYKKSTERADDRLKWLRQQSVAKDLAKERQSFLAEEREQYRETQKSTEPDPDAQASGVAKMLGIEEEDAQRYLSMVGSAFILLLQFICLSLRSFLRHRVEPAIAAQQVADGNSKYSTRNSNGFSKADARSDLDALMAGGFDPRKRGNQALLASRWGWPPNSTGRWLRDQPDLNMPPPGRRNGTKRPRHVNGNGHAMAGSA